MYKKLLATAVMICALAITSAAQTEQAAVKPSTNITVEPILCTGIQDRAPVGEAVDFPANVDKVYLWCRVIGVSTEESTIHHVWLHDGQEMADVVLVVKGNPWRTWSCKTIPPEWAGNWEVKIVDPDGNVLKSLPFTVGSKAEEKKTETPH